mgnify:FL=1
MTKNLTDAEKAFFETNGASEMPDGYLDDAKIVTQDEPPLAASGEAAPPEEHQPETPVDPDNPAYSPEGEAAPVESAPKERPTVPLATYMEEKKARQERDRQLAEVNQRYSQTVDRFQTYLERTGQAAPQSQPEPAPNFEPPDDPIEKIEWAAQQVADMRRHEQETAAHREQVARETAHWQDVFHNYSRAVEHAVAQAPEVIEARTFLITQRVNEHMATGSSQRDAVEAVRNEELRLAADAMAKGIHPVAQVIAVAKARGYVPIAMRQPQQPSNAPVDAAQRLETVAQGQQANVSLSTAGTGGNARSGRVDAKALADMSDKEFAAWVAKDSDGENWRKVMHG